MASPDSSHPIPSASSASSDSYSAVLITGTLSRIGRAIELYLDSQGVRVFAGVRNLDDASPPAVAASYPLPYNAAAEGAHATLLGRSTCRP